MQRLHLVGFTSELDGLIFSAKDGARSGGYVVALDSELMDAIRDVLERRDRHRSPAPVPSFGAARPAEGSALSPREIQARLRAGRRIDEVALEAGVDDEWVRRFAAPVLAERAHVAARAQDAVLELDGPGPSSESLGRAVAANLAARGEALTPGELAGGWDGYQLRETAWVVEFRAPLHAPEDAARWGFDTRTGRLTVINEHGAALGWVGDGRDAVGAPETEEPATGAEEAPGAPPAAVPAAAPSNGGRVSNAAARARPAPAPAIDQGAPTEGDEPNGQLRLDAAARPGARSLVVGALGYGRSAPPQPPSGVPGRV
ncbi:MAG TPA: septation protein SepH, partial [Acidimicrobiales bacterium]|nr:septation protein SepH [Acidimicrobiales bacterium]